MPKKILPATTKILEKFLGTDPRLVLLSTAEQAILMNFAPGTLENMRCRGEGPPYIKLGKSIVRYRLSDTLHYLEQMTHRNEG